MCVNVSKYLKGIYFDHKVMLVVWFLVIVIIISITTITNIIIILIIFIIKIN